MPGSTANPLGARGQLETRGGRGIIYRLDALEKAGLGKMARLPFSVPNDPIFQSRSELYDDAFGQYAVPQAVLRFKQGFGRLIRRKTDRGAMVVLDSRIATKSYGQSFLRSLPPCNVQRLRLVDMPATVASWLDAEA